MISREEANRRWAEICEAVDSDQIDQALELFQAWESVDRLSIEELAQKGRLIQLGSETAAYELEDAKEAFMQALGRYKNYPEALIELGHYVYVGEDDAQGGLEYFEKAIEVTEKLLAEAREGRDQCLQEMADSAEDN